LWLLVPDQCYRLGDRICTAAEMNMRRSTRGFNQQNIIDQRTK
jgi:hypothetical protein